MPLLETHFTNRSYIKVPKYNISHKWHPDETAQAGTAITVRNTLKQHELPKFSPKHLQATNVFIESSSDPITISSAYIPPDTSLTSHNTKPSYGRRLQCQASVLGFQIN